MKKLTPVLFIDTIEPALAFWLDRLGFELTMQVPYGEGPELGFVGMQNGSVEIMLQTHASVRDDLPQLADEPNRATLFVEVEDIDAIEKALEGADIVVPRRKTFYGATEIGVRVPGDHVVIFAQVAE